MSRAEDDNDRDENARQHPAETVDALEERVFGRSDSPADEDQESQNPAPAIEQDIDSDELGSADAGDEPSG